MKKLIVTATVLSTVLAVSALGQTKGFPIADSAGPEPQGGMHVLANGTFVSEGYAMGGRYAYNIVDDFRMFVDLGAVLPEDADDVLGFQLGGLYSIPVEFPVDLGLRLTYYNVDEFQTTTARVEEWGINLLVMASGVWEDINPNLEGYFGLGLNYSDVSQTARNDFGFDAEGDETDFVTAGGLLYHVNDLLSFYGEIGYLNEFAGGLGARFDF